MPRFLVLLSPEHPTRGELSAGALGRRAAAYAKWLDELQATGSLRGGVRLRPSGLRLVRDGMEGRQWEHGVAHNVSGCLLIEATGFEEAVEVTSRCPAVGPGCIEVFELDEGTELGAFVEPPGRARRSRTSA